MIRLWFHSFQIWVSESELSQVILGKLLFYFSALQSPSNSIILCYIVTLFLSGDDSEF